MALYYTYMVCSLLCFISLVESFNGGLTVDLIHRECSSSPSYDPSHTRFQRLRSAFDRAFSRKSSLMSSSYRSKARHSIDAPIIPAGGEYLMKIKLGTPPVEQLLIADTGSDLLWTQCKPCKDCYKQNIPLFNPSRSSSYRTVSCHSDLCAAAGSPSCDTKKGCQYEVGYGDNSYSTGELAFETLTFDGGVSFPKVAFGCGHDDEGTFSQSESGIIGLGGGSISIVKQLHKSIRGKFSYCLTMHNSNVSSKISFGRNAVVSGRKVVSTPLVKKYPTTYYYLTLEGLSVGKERMQYMSSTEASSVDEGNIIIDSGTTLTFVPSELYNGVESALKKAIKGTRVADSQGSFRLCYKVGKNGGVVSPTVTAHFKGADLVLPKESIFLEVDDGISCLTLIPSDDLAIFGNLHQMNYHIGYDLVKKHVSFLPTDCSKRK